MNRLHALLAKRLLMTGMLILLTIQQFVFADDIDIFNAEKPASTPNILFVMDVSGSMAWEVDSKKEPKDPADSRLNILRNALSDLLTDPDMVDVNVGLMSFSGHSGSWLAHGPSYPVAPIDGDAAPILNSNPLFTHPGATTMPAAGFLTTRGYIQQIANTWSAKSGTPIVDALFEAGKYMRGEDIHWGNQPPEEIQAAHPSTYTGLFIADGSTTSKFQCTSEPCGGTTGVACNERKTCNTSSNTTTNTCSTPTCGDTCSPIASALTCPAGLAFCGDATSAAECTTTLNPAINHPCTDVSDLACLAANPGWTSCTLVTTGIGVNDYSCLEPVPDTVVCPVTSYSCTTTTTTTTCTHEICGTITTSGVDYISPITEECQNNAIILLSDGEPTVNDTSPLVASMVGPAYHNNCDTSSSDKGRCGVEIARFLAETDNSTIAGEQPINTYTVGLALTATSKAGEYLKSLADAGGGTFATADSSADLIKAFKDAISGVNKKVRLFSSPTYTANSSSRLSHGNSVYLPVFNRESSPAWSGNLKKFKVNNDGDLLDVNDLKILEDTGVMRADAIDLWATTTPDHAVKGGGAANNIPDPDNRNVYTDDGFSLRDLISSNVSKTQLGDASMSNSRRDTLIDFIRGKDKTNPKITRHHMGDIIHSKPVFVNYDKRKKGGLIFVGTNEGYLHAINDSDGTEAFAYMPSELLKNIQIQYEGVATDHPYGVDSEITVWFDDKNHNGIVETGDKVILFFGLRRGGKAYYALDVTDPDRPGLKWKITPETSGFKELGFTWSKPKIAMIKVKKKDTKLTPVIIFGGGYVDDNGLLSGGVAEPDDSGTGADVYIIDAISGTKIYKKIKVGHAVAADIRVMDIDRNGADDRLYFADTGGNIWRVDLDYGDISDAKTYHFADLGGATTPKRKFFNEPDVAFFRHGAKYINTIAIGSGERPNPLDTSNDDRFFVLIDQHPFTLSDPAKADAEITLTDLVAAPLTSVAELNNKKGWHLDLLNPGITAEKVLSKAITFENKIIFTTFGIGTASGDPVDKCDAGSSNKARFYVLDLLTGKAVLNLDDVSGVDQSTWTRGDISDTPQIYFGTPKAKNRVDDCATHDCIVPKSIVPPLGNPVAAPSPLQKLPRVYWLERDQN